jgi:hypothetical protein
MALTLSNTIELECKRCMASWCVSASDLPTPTEKEFKKSMGYEVEVTWELTHECNKCHSQMHVSLIAYEYPKGTYNMSMPSASGARFVTEPEYSDGWSDVEDEKENSLTSSVTDTSSV